MAKKTKKIGMFYYSDPDLFPPVTNPAKVLAAAGYQVDIIAYYRDRNTWDVDYGPGIRMIRLNKPGMASPKGLVQKIKSYREFISESKKIAKRENYGVIYGHDMHGFIAAHRVARTVKRPLIYHSHESPQLDELGRMDRWVKRYEMRYCNDADLVLLPEARRAEAMVRTHGMKKAPTIVWNCPLRGSYSKTEKLDAAINSGNGKGIKLVIRHGRFGPGHCIEETIQSMPYWPSDLHFALLGFVMRDYAQKQIELAKALGVNDRVHILPAVKYTDVFDYISGADIGHCLYYPKSLNFRFASTASLKLFDYMRVGLPIVASENGGFQPFLEEFDCGTCVDPSDPKGLGAIFSRLCSDAKLREKWGQNAYQAHLNKCNYEAQYAPVLNFLKEVV